MDEKGLKTTKEAMLEKLVEVLGRRDYELVRIAGRAKDGRQSPVIHWAHSDRHFAPDVTARRKGREYIFQLETAETLSAAESREKTALFAGFAEHFRQQFCLVVPAACREEAHRRLLGLHVDERHTHLIAC